MCPCIMCGQGVGVDSNLCGSCSKCCHNRCFRLVRLGAPDDFQCPACIQREAGRDEEDGGVVVAVDGDVLEEVSKFCYLGDVLNGEGGVERAVKVRASATWGKYREISILLLNDGILLSRWEIYFLACIISGMLYVLETRTRPIEECSDAWLVSVDGTMRVVRKWQKDAE